MGAELTEVISLIAEIGLAGVVYVISQQYRNDGKEREVKYQEIISKQNERFDRQDEQLVKIANTQERILDRLDILEKEESLK